MGGPPPPGPATPPSGDEPVLGAWTANVFGGNVFQFELTSTGTVAGTHTNTLVGVSRPLTGTWSYADATNVVTLDLYASGVDNDWRGTVTGRYVEEGGMIDGRDEVGRRWALWRPGKQPAGQPGCVMAILGVMGVAWLFTVLL